jgi:hypothetical protein
VKKFGFDAVGLQGVGHFPQGGVSAALFSGTSVDQQYFHAGLPLS